MDDWKIKISVLWLFYTVAFLAVMTLGTMEPGVLSQFLDTGEIGGMKIGQELLLFFAVMMLVPLVMAFLSLTLKDSTNRWANVIVGIVYTGFQLFALIETLAVTICVCLCSIDGNRKSCCSCADCLVLVEV